MLAEDLVKEVIAKQRRHVAQIEEQFRHGQKACPEGRLLVERQMINGVQEMAHEEIEPRGKDHLYFVPFGLLRMVQN